MTGQVPQTSRSVARSPLVRGALLAWKRCACVRRHASPVQQPWLYLISCRELFNLKLRVPRSNRIVCNVVYFFRGGIFSSIIERIELSTEPDDKTFVLSGVYVSRSNPKRKRKKFGSLSGHCLILTLTGKMEGKKIIPWTLEQIRLHERATVQRSCQISRTGAFSPETRPDLIITNYVRVRADYAYMYIYICSSNWNVSSILELFVDRPMLFIH